MRAERVRRRRIIRTKARQKGTLQNSSSEIRSEHDRIHFDEPGKMNLVKRRQATEYESRRFIELQRFSVVWRAVINGLKGDLALQSKKFGQEGPGTASDFNIEALCVKFEKRTLETPALACSLEVAGERFNGHNNRTTAWIRRRMPRSAEASERSELAKVIGVKFSSASLDTQGKRFNVPARVVSSEFLEVRKNPGVGLKGNDVARKSNTIS